MKTISPAATPRRLPLTIEFEPSEVVFLIKYIKNPEASSTVTDLMARLRDHARANGEQL